MFCSNNGKSEDSWEPQRFHHSWWTSNGAWIFQIHDGQVAGMLHFHYTHLEPNHLHGFDQWILEISKSPERRQRDAINWSQSARTQNCHLRAVYQRHFEQRWQDCLSNHCWFADSRWLPWEVGLWRWFSTYHQEAITPTLEVLAHVFVNCVSGRKGGSDEISSRNTQAIVALAAGINFNFSRFILEEMVTNLNKKAKDQFLLYPRFI